MLANEGSSPDFNRKYGSTILQFMQIIWNAVQGSSVIERIELIRFRQALQPFSAPDRLIDRTAMGSGVSLGRDCRHSRPQAD